jgi:hypothetical protein
MCLWMRSREGGSGEPEIFNILCMGRRNDGHEWDEFQIGWAVLYLQMEYQQ